MSSTIHDPRIRLFGCAPLRACFALLLGCGAGGEPADGGALDAATGNTADSGDAGDSCDTRSASGIDVDVEIIDPRPWALPGKVQRDATGSFHLLVSSDASLSYATNASGRWVLSVPTDAVPNGSLAVDGSGVAHFAYVHRGVWHAANDTGTFVPERIAFGVWHHVSIVATPEGALHAFYADAPGSCCCSFSCLAGPQVGYSNTETGAWEAVDLDALGEPLPPPSFVGVDPLGALHLLGSSGAGVRHATRSEGQWTLDSVPLAGFEQVVLASDGAIHLLFEGAYLANDSGRWRREQVTRPGAGGGLALDGEGHAHVLSFDPGEGNLQYATNASGAWRTGTIARLTEATVIDLAVDSEGHCHATYATSGGEVRYVTNASGGWTGGSTSGLGALALDPQDGVHLLGATAEGAVDARVRSVPAAPICDTLALRPVLRGGIAPRLRGHGRSDRRGQG